MDRADSARLAVVIRESARADLRTDELREGLARPDLARFLRVVDDAQPGLADTERLRIAEMLRRLTLRQPGRESIFLNQARARLAARRDESEATL